MSKIKRLAGDTILYGLGSMVPRFINFLLVALHTSVFLPEQYGIISKLFGYTAVLNTIFTFGMETAYFRFSTREGANEERIFNIAQTIVIGISLVLSLILIIFADSVAHLVKIEGHGDYIIWLAVIMFIDAVVAIPFARLRLRKKAILFAAGRIINIVLFVGFNLYFLKYAFPESPSIAYVWIANFLANLFFVFFFFKTLIRWRPAYDSALTPTMASYAYPVMITGLAGMTNEMFSRVTLDQWLPENFYEGQTPEYALGIFSACYKLAVLMSLAVTAFRYAAEPFFFSNAADKNSPQLFARVNHYFVIVCCILLLGVGINLDILKYFLGDPKYWEGLHIVPVLLIAYLFLGVYFNVSIWFKLSDKTYWGTIITIGGVLVTIVANYILIPRFGYEGSSFASLICYFAMTVACYLLGQKYLPIPYNVTKSLAYIIITTAIVYAVNSISITNTWLALTFHAAVVVVYLLAIFFFEKREFKTIVR